MKRSDEDIERVIQRLIGYGVITRESRITIRDSIREEKIPLLSIEVGRERGYDFVVYTKPEMIGSLLQQSDGVYYNVNLREGGEPKYKVERKKVGGSVKRIAFSETIDEKFIYPVKQDFVKEIDSIAKSTKS